MSEKISLDSSDLDSSKCKFRFSNCNDDTITCEWDNYNQPLPCKSTKVNPNSVIQRFEIKWMQMDTLLYSPHFKELFSKQSFETVLSFFEDFIYWLYELLQILLVESSQRETELFLFTLYRCIAEYGRVALDMGFEKIKLAAGLG